GHRGGNDFARRVGEVLGGEAVVTTASEFSLGVALDEPPRGWTLLNPRDLASFTMGLLGGARLRLSGAAEGAEWLSGIPNLRDAGSRDTLTIHANEWSELVRRPREMDGKTLLYGVGELSLGLGASKDCPGDEMNSLVRETLEAAGIPASAVGVIATWDGKENEPAIVNLNIDDKRSSALVSEDSLTSHDVGSSERRQLMPAGAARKKIKRVKRDDKGGVVSRGIGDNEGVARDEVELAYDRAADLLRAELRAGNNVVVLCEGDPFFYGSFGYLYERLSGEREVEVIPGVSSLTATAATAGRVLALGGESFCILSGVAPIDFLRERLSAGENFAIIKPSRCWRELLAVLDDLGLLPRARLVVRSGLPDEMVYDLEHSRPASVPYFSVVLIR
ncbi:MAG: cobalamin biosynthesis protein, partial [Alphaproteobacteria bacterium]|nr:cobalamin biosynthesis protein [Alphaproteobacteria bacterium]